MLSSRDFWKDAVATWPRLGWDAQTAGFRSPDSVTSSLSDCASALFIKLIEGPLPLEEKFTLTHTSPRNGGLPHVGGRRSQGKAWPKPLLGFPPGWLMGQGKLFRVGRFEYFRQPGS